MKGFITVDSAEDYKTWMDEQAAELGEAGEEVW
jgi:hypothetical protein